MKRRGPRSSCPVDFALDAFGDAWTLLLVRDLLYSGGATYTELLQAKERIATNILADRLARLETRAMIRRAEDGRYQLTQKGKDLLPILREMVIWSAKYDPRTTLPAELVRRIRKGGDEAAVLAELRARWQRKRNQDG